MKTNRQTKTILPLAAAMAAFAMTTSANADVVVPLSNAFGGTVWFGSPDGPLTDGFSYNPDNPTSTSPNQLWGGSWAQLFHSQNGDANNYWGAQVTTGGTISLDHLDIWATSAATVEARSRDLVFSFYTSTDATTGLLGTSSSWSGVSDTPEAYGRFDVSTVIADAATRATIQSIRIDHTAGSTLYLALLEVRAAGAAVPTGGVPNIIDVEVLGNGDVLLTLDGSESGLTAQQSDDLTGGSFLDVASTPGTNTLTIAAGLVDPDLDGADYFRLRN
jgi:hypothetical protein